MKLLLQPPIRRCDKLGRELRTASGQARPSRPRHTVSSMPRSLRAPRAHLEWRLGSFVTNHHEYCGLAGRSHLFGTTGTVAN